MGTESRKQREFAQREEMFLDCARKMLVEHGYAGLSMDRIAEATEYSKGVVYQHFTSKEDLIAAMSVKSFHERTALFKRAAAFSGRHRERMAAIGMAAELFVRLHPHHYHSERIIRFGSLRDRLSAERGGDMESLEQQCFGTVKSIVDDAVTAGDLVLPPHLSAAEVVLGLWAINEGSFNIMHCEHELLARHGITQPFNAVRGHCMALLDGINWRPLSNEWDYEQTFGRIVVEVFPAEAAAVGMIPAGAGGT